MPEATGDFDAERFAQHWRDAEPWLRRKVAKFADPDFVDDVVGEVAARMLERGIDKPTRKAFVLEAETIAWRFAVDTWRRDRLADKEKVIRAWLALSDEGAVELADHDVDDRVHAELVVRPVLADLLSGRLGLSESKVASIRRGIELMLEGGPYSDAERQQISRARAKLRDFLVDGGLAGEAGMAGWLLGVWRRARRLRTLRTPRPSLAAMAGGLTATVLAGFMPSGASPAAVAVSTRTDAVVSTAARTLRGLGTVTDERVPATVTTATTRPQVQATTAAPERPTLVGATTTARLPSPSGPGEVSVVLVDGSTFGQGGTTVGTELWCDTELRRTVCSAVAAESAVSTGTGLSK